MTETPELHETAGWGVAAAEASQGSLMLLTRTGSRAYGTDRPESDHDFRGVYAHTLPRYCAMDAPVKTIDVSEPHDAVLYELSHFARLASKANPTALEVLWGDEFIGDSAGRYLREKRGLFLSKRIVQTYGGYAMSQLKKAEAGTGGSRGADHHKRMKFRLHTLRLLLVGNLALKTGEITVRLTDVDALNLRICAGQSMAQFKATAEASFRLLDATAKTSPLPDVPDEDEINAVLYELRTS